MLHQPHPITSIVYGRGPCGPCGHGEDGDNQGAEPLALPGLSTSVSVIAGTRRKCVLQKCPIVGTLDGEGGRQLTSVQVWATSYWLSGQSQVPYGKANLMPGFFEYSLSPSPSCMKCLLRKSIGVPRRHNGGGFWPRATDLFPSAT